MRKAACFFAGLMLVVAIVVAVQGGSPRLLSAQEQLGVVGAQLSDFKCLLNIATCDQLNFQDACNLGLGEGDPCDNCTNETAMVDNCVQKKNFTCTQFTAANDCGNKVQGKCQGGVCTGGSGGSEACPLDASDCS
jgi:hypothetical protein